MTDHTCVTHPSGARRPEPTDHAARAEADLVAASGYYDRARHEADPKVRGQLVNEANRCLQLAKVRAQLAQADAMDRLVWLVDEITDRLPTPADGRCKCEAQA